MITCPSGLTTSKLVLLAMTATKKEPYEDVLNSRACNIVTLPARPSKAEKAGRVVSLLGTVSKGTVVVTEKQPVFDSVLEANDAVVPVLVEASDVTVIVLIVDVVPPECDVTIDPWVE